MEKACWNAIIMITPRQLLDSLMDEDSRGKN